MNRKKPFPLDLNKGGILLYIVDRFEGDWIVIEGDEKQYFNLPKKLLPEAQEGDVILIKADVDVAASTRRRKETAFIMKDFFDQ